MRRDFQIAILLAVSTIPCGAWIAVAPEYLHIKGTALAITYWCGMVLTALLIIAALLLALRAESKTPPKGHGRRMVAIVGMAICGFGFLAFSTIFFLQRPFPDGANEDHAVDISKIDKEVKSLADQPDYVETIRHMPVIQLREHIFEVCREMRALEDEIWTQMVPRSGSISLDKSNWLSTQMENEWLSKYRLRSAAMYDELLRRTGRVKPRFPDSGATIFMTGTRIGNHNMSRLCELLEGLAREMR